MQKQEQVILIRNVSPWRIFKFVFSLKTVILILVAMWMFENVEESIFRVFLAQLYIFLYAYFFLRTVYIVGTKYYILTDKRLMAKSRLSKSVRYVPLKQIASVSITGRRFWGRVFNFGHLTIDTTGKEYFRPFRYVSRPDDISEAISNAIE